jgi:hypothetical protein
LFADGSGKLVWTAKAPGSGTWTNWDSPASAEVTGDLAIGTDLDVGADLTVGGIATITGDLVADSIAANDILGAQNGVFVPGSSGNYNLAPALVRDSMLQIADAYGDVFRSGTNGSVSSGSGGIVAWPVRVGDSFGGGTIDVAYTQAGAAGATFNLIARAVNFSTGAVTRTVVDTFTGPASSGNQTGSLSFSGAPDPDTDYSIEFVQATSGDAVNGLRMSAWQDGGPRNVF